jgi:hypothetical protein
LKQTKLGIRSLIWKCYGFGASPLSLEKQYAQLETTQIWKIKWLTEENAPLKKLVAEFSFDRAVLRFAM